MINALKHKYIFTPGPVPMYADTLQIGAMQTPYFRNEAFSQVVLECENSLLKLVNAPDQSRVVFLTASGTAGMEAVVQNLLAPEDQTLIINGGGFGQRFVDICKLHQMQYIDYQVDNDNLSDTDSLIPHKHASALLINGHETSIGTLYNLKQTGLFCKQHKLLNIVDAISMFISDELDMQKQHIDALIVSSHKGLALPPGLTMVILAPLAIAKINPAAQLYFDFNRYLNDGKRGQTPFTPAITIMLQLQERLRHINLDGIAVQIEKKKEVAEYFREQIAPLPLKLYSHFLPNALTALTPTDGRFANEIVKDLDDRFNVVLTPNGGELKEIVFRVSHLGNIDKAYTEILLNALFEYYEIKR